MSARPATVSRPASDAAEQVLESRPSGVPPPAGKLVWAKLARYPWWPAEVSTSLKFASFVCTAV